MGAMPTVLQRSIVGSTSYIVLTPPVSKLSATGREDAIACTFDAAVARAYNPHPFRLGSSVGRATD